MKAVVSIVILICLLERITSEIDLRFLNENVNPCDDFYEFSCGNFLKYYQKPQNQSLLDMFSVTEDELVQIGKDILSHPKQKSDPISLKKAKAAYKSCVNINQKDNLWYYQFPEKAIIDEFGGMPLITKNSATKINFSEVARLAAQFGIHHFFQFSIKNFNPDFYILILLTDSQENIAMIRPKSVKTYEEILSAAFRKLAKTKSIKSRLVDEKDPLDNFVLKVATYLLSSYGVTYEYEHLIDELNKVKNFMVQLYSGGIQDDDFIPTDNPPLTLRALQNWTITQFGNDLDIDWIDFLGQQFKLARINITEDFMVYPVSGKSIYGILNLIRKTDPSVVKNFLLLRTFLLMAPDSDLPMRQAFEEYYRSVGAQFYQRSDYCARKLLDVIDTVSLSFAISNNFVNYHFNINKIPAAVKVIHNIRESFKEVVRTYQWVDEESQNEVIKKIDNIAVFLGYPDFIDNTKQLDQFYENLRICEWDNYGNSKRIRAFRQAYALRTFEDHDTWTLSPFEVNAFTVRASNRIMAPLSILSPWYFNGKNVIFDYSRFGTILAHEFIHHFDTVGIVYDSDGMQNPLLTNSTENAFNDKTNCFVDQYNKFYVPEIDKYVNGSNTLNENLADHGGLKHAYAAFLKQINHILKENKKEEKYTAQQQFFINFAASYCSEEAKDYLENLVENNNHSPGRFRVLGTLSNMQEFAEAFNCPVGSNMNSKNKCQIW